MMANAKVNPLRIPEIVEKIVENLGVDDLFTISKLGGMWYKIARHEAYERWKMCANSFENAYREAQAIREKQGKNLIGWLEAVYEEESLNEWMDIQTEIQVSIMEKMLKNKMIVDPKEKETIKHVINERNWGVGFIQLQLTIRMGMKTSSR